MAYLEECYLYYKRSCESCRRVLSFMDGLGARMLICDVSHPGLLRDLVNLTGRRAVPCLIVRGKAVYGEDEIVRAIRAEAAGPAHAPEKDPGRAKRRM